MGLVRRGFPPPYLMSFFEAIDVLQSDYKEYGRRATSSLNYGGQVWAGRPQADHALGLGNRAPLGRLPRHRE